MEKISNDGPRHIGIILDGNRRWAKEKGLEPKDGHKEGAKRLKKIVEYAYSIGLEYLTVYAFSTENWKRSASEVATLMQLLLEYTEDEIKNNDKRDICIRVYGDESKLSNKLIKNLNILKERTKNRKKLVFGICLNYGGRQEIINMVKKISLDVKKGNLDISKINEDIISNNLYTAGIPDLDLVIRTSGEYRISNFLPWQITYSELYFPKIYWPDFDEKQLDIAIDEYKKRKRRYGK